MKIVQAVKKSNSILRERLNFRRRPIVCTTLYRNPMQASNFGGAFDQLFLWISLWNFHRRCISILSIPWCKKSQKWPKTQIKGGGGVPALNTCGYPGWRFLGSEQAWTCMFWCKGVDPHVTSHCHRSLPQNMLQWGIRLGGITRVRQVWKRPPALFLWSLLFVKGEMFLLFQLHAWKRERGREGKGGRKLVRRERERERERERGGGWGGVVVVVGLSQTWKSDRIRVTVCICCTPLRHITFLKHNRGNDKRLDKCTELRVQLIVVQSTEKLIKAFIFYHKSDVGRAGGINHLCLASFVQRSVDDRSQIFEQSQSLRRLGILPSIVKTKPAIVKHTFWIQSKETKMSDKNLNIDKR